LPLLFYLSIFSSFLEGVTFGTNGDDLLVELSYLSYLLSKAMSWSTSISSAGFS